MGIIFSNAALLAKAKQRGICFDQILTIGHQNLYVRQDQIQKLAATYGLHCDPEALAKDRYANRFLETLLGAQRVQSLDYSDYEQCDIVHDLNLPINLQYHQQFDAVIDGGTLEHIFNFPTAIANCMNMVKVGGSLFLFTMANNHAGHGFYQFSPELFFRIFQPENGYAIQDVILEVHDFPGAELSHSTTCYSVVDPAAVKSRVGLVTKSCVMMMVHAIRTESKPPFASSAIQSDYSAIYAAAPASSDPTEERRSIAGSIKNVAKSIYHRLPVRWQNFVNGHRQRRHYSLANRQFYRRWDPLG
jgi:hypothetical protein